MCDCIQKYEKHLGEKYGGKPSVVHVNSVEMPTTFTPQRIFITAKVSVDVQTKAKDGTATTIRNAKIYADFCPFCGEKYPIPEGMYMKPRIPITGSGPRSVKVNYKGTIKKVRP